MRLTIPRRLSRAATAALVATLIALGPSVAFAAPQPAQGAPIASVGIVAPVWASQSGLVAEVHVTLHAAVRRLTVALQAYDTGGHLVWQRTQSRRELVAQSYSFDFSRPPGSARLPQGVYTLRAKVRVSNGRAPADVTGALVLADPGTGVVPVSVVVRLTGAPTRDPSGVFVVDPIDDGGTRTQAEALAQLANERPDLHITAVIPPILMDEWRDAADGYSFAAAGGVTQVAADTTRTAAFAATLATVASAVASGMPTLRAMYADPDPGGLVSAGGVPTDVAGQLALGERVTTQTLGSALATASIEPTGLAIAGDLLPQAFATPVTDAGVGFALVDASSVKRSQPGTVPPGAYDVFDASSGSGSRPASLTALVVDRQGSRMLADPAGGSTLAARLFRSASTRTGASQPVVLVVNVGPGGASVADLQPALTTLADLPWVRLVSAATAAGSHPAGRVSLVGTPPESRAPSGYWEAVMRARSRAQALTLAAGEDDQDARAALADAYVSESSLWRGPKGDWSLSDRGLAFAAAGDRIAQGVLDKITVDVPSVTLSSSSGKVPVSIKNGSDKTLRVTVLASSSEVEFPKPRITARLRPGENILYVPVDLGPSLSGNMSVRVASGDLPLAAATTVVRASYLDRFVILGGIVLVLLGLLFYIWRRERLAGREAS